MSLRLGLRQRVAAWCALLVVGSGVIVVLLVVVLSGRFLEEHNRPDDPRSQPALGAPAVPGAPGAVAGPGGDPSQQSRREAADETFAEVRTVGLVAVGVLSIVGIGVGWAVAGRIVRPVQQVTATARSITEDHRLDRRIAYDGPPDELHELADGFDQMLDKLEGVFAGQRAFVADASHELRTPLAVMRTEVDVALDDPGASAVQLRDALAAVGDEIDRTTGLVTAMLALARAEALRDPRPVDLAEVVMAAVDAGPGEVRAEVVPTVVWGDPVLLRQLVANLVRNAVDHGSGPVSIRIEAPAAPAAPAAAGGLVRLVVENGGLPLDPQEVASLFGRFAHGHASEGHGLGLAICQAIVESHGGTIGARPRSGGGLTVTVGLPSDRGRVSAPRA